MKKLIRLIVNTIFDTSEIDYRTQKEREDGKARRIVELCAVGEGRRSWREENEFFGLIINGYVAKAGRPIRTKLERGVDLEPEEILFLRDFFTYPVFDDVVIPVPLRQQLRVSLPHEDKPALPPVDGATMALV